MKQIRQFVGVAVIAAVLNPLCCCFADVVAAIQPPDEVAHGCCSQPAGQAPSDKAPKGCATDEGCPHESKAFESAQIFASQHLVTAPSPVVVTIESLGIGSFEAVIPSRLVRDQQSPPGRHEPPAYLLTHSFLN